MMAVLISLLCGCGFAVGAIVVVLIFGATAKNKAEKNHDELFGIMKDANLQRARIATALELMAIAEAKR